MSCLSGFKIWLSMDQHWTLGAMSCPSPCSRPVVPALPLSPQEALATQRLCRAPQTSPRELWETCLHSLLEAYETADSILLALITQRSCSMERVRCACKQQHWHLPCWRAASGWLAPEAASLLVLDGHT